MAGRNDSGYTLDDLVYWGPLMLTMAGTYLLFETLELNRLVCLILSGLCGVAAGFTAELIFRRMKSGPPRSDGDERN